MNAEDILRALLEGRTIVYGEPNFPQVEYKLGEGFIESKREDGTIRLERCVPHMELDRTTIEDDSRYHLNFSTAMMAAIQARRRIRSVESGIVYEIRGAILVNSESKQPTGISSVEIAGTWRLVE